jgi:hypothetical protein
VAYHRVLKTILWSQANHVTKIWDDIALAGDLPKVVEDSGPVWSDNECAPALPDSDRWIQCDHRLLKIAPNYFSIRWPRLGQ